MRRDAGALPNVELDGIVEDGASELAGAVCQVDVLLWSSKSREVLCPIVVSFILVCSSMSSDLGSQAVSLRIMAAVGTT